jgi:hypothetical protein
MPRLGPASLHNAQRASNLRARFVYDAAGWPRGQPRIPIHGSGTMKTLEQACTPRASVFTDRNADTVYNIDDLEQLDPKKFFAENYPTEGMKQLLSEAFKRLERKSSSARGAFLLSQSMGGGKTHNLIALGLLAKYPEFRPGVMAGFYEPGPHGERQGHLVQRTQDPHALRPLGRAR